MSRVSVAGGLDCQSLKSFGQKEIKLSLDTGHLHDLRVSACFCGRPTAPLYRHRLVIAAYDAKSAAGVLAQHSLQRILPKCNAPPPGAADPG